MQVKVKVLRGTGLPKQAYPGDVCFDLEWRPENNVGPKKLFRHHPAKFQTGIALGLPSGYEAVVRPRSGLAAKYAVLGLVGTIDSGYRGELHVVLMNTGVDPVLFTPGQRIAQLAIRQAPMIHLVEVDELDETERGDSGFGSSGR